MLRQLVENVFIVEQGGAESIDNPLHEAAKRGVGYHVLFCL